MVPTTPNIPIVLLIIASWPNPSFPRRRAAATAAANASPCEATIPRRDQELPRRKRPRTDSPRQDSTILLPTARRVVGGGAAGMEVVTGISGHSSTDIPRDLEP